MSAREVFEAVTFSQIHRGDPYRTSGSGVDWVDFVCEQHIGLTPHLDSLRVTLLEEGRGEMGGYKEEIAGGVI